MPAPSYQALYDFPGNLASAAKSILTADITALLGSDTHANQNAFIFGPRENLEKPVDSIEITATDFHRASFQQVLASTNSEWFMADHAGALTFNVITPRSVAVAAAEHGTRVGRIMYLMQPRARKFTADNLPYYEICDISLANQPRAEADEDLDAHRTELTFNVRLWLKPDSFPVTIP